MKRISKEKRTLILALLVEGNTINGICRMLKMGKPTLLRFLNEVGEACEDWHDRHFVDLEVNRLELDEQWSFVHTHKERMEKKERQLNPKKGDFWLWAALDPDSKAIITWHTGKRRKQQAQRFVDDLADRIDGNVQITTDKLQSYKPCIRAAFGNRAHHVEEEKHFEKITGGPNQLKVSTNKLLKVTKAKCSGEPDMETATTSHVERYFLTMRQGNKRCARKTLAYSKDWGNHSLATSIHIFIYNMVRKHETLKTAPAVALGLIDEPWSLDHVVDMVDAYMAPIRKAKIEEAAKKKRQSEDAEFEKAFESKFGPDPKPRLTWEPEEPKTPWYLDPESGGRNPKVKKKGINYDC